MRVKKQMIMIICEEKKICKERMGQELEAKFYFFMHFYMKYFISNKNIY